MAAGPRCEAAPPGKDRTMTGKLDERVAFITGAGSGIGRATAELFASEGAAVDTWGRLDVLYNNAGVDSRGSVADATEDDWDRCFSVNVKGTFLCSRAAVPHVT